MNGIGAWRCCQARLPLIKSIGDCAPGKTYSSVITRIILVLLGDAFHNWLTGKGETYQKLESRRKLRLISGLRNSHWEELGTDGREGQEGDSQAGRGQGDQVIS